MTPAPLHPAASVSASDMANPDGIHEDHVRPQDATRHASVASIIILGSLMFAAATGVLGGGKNVTTTLRTSQVTVSVNTPATIRNGQIFETHIKVRALRPLQNIIIAIEPTLWRDQTINSVIPAPEKEAFASNAFQFSYGKLAKGSNLHVKIDHQINPALFGGTKGSIIISDDAVVLATIPVALRVLP